MEEVRDLFFSVEAPTDCGKKITHFTNSLHIRLRQTGPTSGRVKRFQQQRYTIPLSLLCVISCCVLIGFEAASNAAAWAKCVTL